MEIGVLVAVDVCSTFDDNYIAVFFSSFLVSGEVGIGGSLIDFGESVDFAAVGDFGRAGEVHSLGQDGDGWFRGEAFGDEFAIAEGYFEMEFVGCRCVVAKVFDFNGLAVAELDTLVGDFLIVGTTAYEAKGQNCCHCYG